LERLEVGWGKVAFWSTKEAICLKRVKIDEKLLWTWRAYRNSTTLFRTVPSPTTYGLNFPRLGVRNPIPNLAGSIHAHCTGSIRTKAHYKFWRKGSVGVSRDLPNFFSTPYYLNNGLSYVRKIWPVHSQGPSEQNPLKFWRKGSVGLFRDCPKVFEYPLLSQDWLKLCISNFVITFMGWIGTKAH